MPYEVPAARFAAAPQAPAATVDIHHLVQSCEAVIAEWSRQKSLFPILSRDGWMDDRVAELRTAIQAAPSTLPGVVFDMVALVKQLVLEHRIAEPNSLLAATALEYLKGHGLLASPLQIHSDDAALDRFTLAMRAKLAAARAKGRSGWESCPPEVLNRMLRDHIKKGDPRDVANFCMFLWHRGYPTCGAIPAGDVPALPAIKGAWIDGGYVIVTPAGTGQAKAVKAAILAALPVAPDAAPAKDKGMK
jgi:hypothetical protein